MDKATGEPFLVNEEEVAAELEFAPEDYNGYANVTFAFDARRSPRTPTSSSSRRFCKMASK